MILLKKQDFQNIGLGQKLYLVSDGKIDQYYYAGISPIAGGDHAMLIHATNVGRMTTAYLPGVEKYSKSSAYTDNYEEAKIIMLDQLEKELEAVKDIFFNEPQYDEAFWRDRKIKKIL